MAESTPPSPSQETLREYLQLAGRAMFLYQMIEEALKAYIVLAHRTIEENLPVGICYRFERAEYDNMPLERLLGIYGRLTPDAKLLKELNALREERNHIAHRAFARAFLSRVSPGIYLEDELARVRNATQAVERVFEGLKADLNKMGALAKQYGIE